MIASKPTQSNGILSTAFRIEGSTYPRFDGDMSACVSGLKPWLWTIDLCNKYRLSERTLRTLPRSFSRTHPMQRTQRHADDPLLEASSVCNSWEPTTMWRSTIKRSAASSGRAGRRAKIRSSRARHAERCRETRNARSGPTLRTRHAACQYCFWVPLRPVASASPLVAECAHESCS